MKRWKTLLWVEYRRSRVWAAALLGSVAFWWWGLLQVRVDDMAQQLEIRAGLLLGAAAVGLVILLLMIGRIRSETKEGTHQVLLMTPASGYTHVLARFGFAIGVGTVYYVALMFLAWWSLARAGMPLGAGDVTTLVLGLPLYGVGAILAPALAWTMLLIVYISAYRVSGPNWIPGTVMVLATPFVLERLGHLIVRVAYELPGWPVFWRAQAMLQARYPEDVIGSRLVIPQEPLWIFLAASVVMLVAAGRIWQEVEG